MEKWVAEFVLSHQQNPRAYSSTTTAALFSGLKKFANSEDCGRLKITAVLRDISNSLIGGNIDEKMLDLLEILEKLLLLEHSVITGSLKSAYCWTAVECSLRFMWPVSASDGFGFFGDALERIWTKRIGILKEKESNLVTRELLKWEIDLKKASEEPEIYQKIRETNIRYIAVTHLSQLLDDHWSLLGCSSLESEARKLLLKPNQEPGICERESNREKAAANEIDKEIEQEEEREAILNMGDRTVAKELKDYLLEIQGLIHLSSEQSQGPNHSPDVPSQARTEEGGGEDHNETSSSSSQRVRPHLPSPEPLNLSPLKQRRLANKPHPRRPMKFWTPEETEALKEGVKEHGRSWKYIKELNPIVLANRTDVDLKDKWRNLIGREK